MGRMSAYTGKAVTWEQALDSSEALVPDEPGLRPDAGPAGRPPRAGDMTVSTSHATNKRDQPGATRHGPPFTGVLGAQPPRSRKVSVNLIRDSIELEEPFLMRLPCAASVLWVLAVSAASVLAQDAYTPHPREPEGPRVVPGGALRPLHPLGRLQRARRRRVGDAEPARSRSPSTSATAAPSSTPQASTRPRGWRWPRPRA